MAPAGLTISANGHTGTYTDLDGDLVTVKITKGDLHHATTLWDATDATVMNGQLLTVLTLTAAEFAGTDVSIVAVHGTTGDGLANIGWINATGNNLGKVVVDGDLTNVACGVAGAGAVGLKSLVAQSMGTLQAGAFAIISNITGSIGSITVKGDLHNVEIFTSNGLGLANIGSLTVGGSIVDSYVVAADNFATAKVVGGVYGIFLGAGLSATHGKLAQVSIGGSVVGGQIAATDIGTVKIAGDLRAGSLGSGAINAEGHLGSVAIGGSLVGGSSLYSGCINGWLGVASVVVGGDVRGGVAAHSGAIEAGQLDATTDAITHTGALAKVTVGGSLIGGSAKFSGSILSVGSLGSATVRHDVIGGSASNTGDIDSFADADLITVGGRLQGGPVSYSGRIVAANGDLGVVKVRGDVVGAVGADTGIVFAGGDIANVTIGGSVFSGNGVGSGSIRSGAVLGPVKVSGDLVGSQAHPVYITAKGLLMAPVGSSPVAMKSVTVLGSAHFASLVAGISAFSFAPMNGDAGIGSVKIGADAIGVRIAAGTGAGGDGILGTSDDSFLGGGNPNVLSTIASITVGGQVAGTPSGMSGTDGYAFIAQKIGSVKIAGNPPLLPPAGATIGIGPTHDVTIRTS